MKRIHDAANKALGQINYKIGRKKSDELWNHNLECLVNEKKAHNDWLRTQNSEEGKIYIRYKYVKKKEKKSYEHIMAKGM